MTDNMVVNDLPRRAITRTAKLATLPVGLAGRTALGLGKRLGGRPAELVAAEIQHRTADQIFRVLGELKGGAMKFGQALSIFEAALPPEIAGPYRATLTKLQESAPPLPDRHGAPCPRRGPRPGLARGVRRVQRQASRRGLDRAGAPRPLAGRPRGSGKDPVSGRRARAAQRLQPAQPRGAAVLCAHAGARGEAAARRAARQGRGRTRLPPRSRVPARVRGRLRRRPGHLRARCGRRGPAMS